MRENLFKAKRLDNGDWVCGDLLQYLNGDCKIHWYDHGMRVSSDVVLSTVCEYTGKNDKNGVKVFEGDKVKFAEWDYGEMCWFGSIVYKDCLFAIKGGPNEECFDIPLIRIPEDRIEVIGNIHDKED